MVDLDLGDSAAIIAEAKRLGVLRNQLAYILATAKWETAHTIKPVRETLATSDHDAAARLETAWKRGKLPWVKVPYWREGWFGRGYVQLTHRDNYARAQRELGIGTTLTENPSKALDPDIARGVLIRGMLGGWFTGHRLGQYVNLQKSDFVEARRVVNGTDRKHEIAALATEYDGALLSVGYGVEPIDTPHEEPTEPDKANWLAALIKAIISIFSR